MEFQTIKQAKVSSKARNLLNRIQTQVKLFNTLGDVAGFKNVGYVPTKSCIYIAHGIPSIHHEISHMVEMRNFDRLLIADWGLSQFNKTPPSKMESWVSSAIRETRVFGIQFHLTSKDCQTDFINRHTKHFVNWNWEQQLKASHSFPFGKFQSFDDIMQYLVDTFETSMKAWDLDRIETEWQKRIDFIQEWQETQQLQETK